MQATQGDDEGVGRAQVTEEQRSDATQMCDFTTEVKLIGALAAFGKNQNVRNPERC